MLYTQDILDAKLAESVSFGLSLFSVNPTPLEGSHVTLLLDTTVGKFSLTSPDVEIKEKHTEKGHFLLYYSSLLAILLAYYFSSIISLLLFLQSCHPSYRLYIFTHTTLWSTPPGIQSTLSVSLLAHTTSCDVEFFTLIFHNILSIDVQDFFVTLRALSGHTNKLPWGKWDGLYCMLAFPSKCMLLLPSPPFLLALCFGGVSHLLGLLKTLELSKYGPLLVLPLSLWLPL